MASSPAKPKTRAQLLKNAFILRARALSVRLSAVAALNAEKLNAENVPPPPPGPKKELFERPEWRLNWFLFQRAYPYDTLPSQGRFNAYAPFFQTEALPPDTPAPTERWVSIGPTPIVAQSPGMGVTSGRVTCVAVSPVDPQTILVGGATGGIWRSVDGGKHFSPVSDAHVDLAVGSIAFAPSNPSIVYAGMGDVAGGYMGTGVLKSNDGGLNWRRISGPTLPAPGLISNVAVERSNPDRVYITQYSYRVSTGQGEVFASGFFLSTDGGVTWRKTLTGLATDLVHHPNNANTLYVAVTDKFATTPPSAGVYRSLDGGETWQIAFRPPYLRAHDMKIAVTPANPSMMYVLTGDINGTARVNLMVTRDEGGTWEKRSLSRIDLGQFGYNSYIAVHPAQPNTIYIGTRDLYKSNNGGIDWINLTGNWHSSANGYWFNPEAATSHTDQHVFVFSPLAPDVIYIGNDGGLSRSSDGGDTFSSLNDMLSLTQFNSVTIHPSDALRSCGGTQDNGALVRGPDDQKWTEFVTGDSGGCLMNPLDPSIWYTSYIFGVLFRYSNHGSKSEAQLTDPTTFGEDPNAARIAFYPPFVLDSPTGRLYFASWRLYSSSDEGLTWPLVSTLDLTHGWNQKFGFDVVSAIAVDPRNSDLIITGSAQGRVMITTNGGRDWKDVTTGLPKRFITSLTVDSKSNAIYATVSGFGSGHVFRTRDQGATWTNLSATLPNAPVNALLLDPLNSNTIYVGTDVGVFRSTNNGQQWDIFNQGMPPVIVTGFSAQQSGLVQVATYGRGVYQLVR